MRNRSVPADILLSHLAYRDVTAAAAWLSAAFGFVEHYRYGEPVAGIQMQLGKACIMLKAARADFVSPEQCGHATQSLTVFVDDVDAHYARAQAAGAAIVEALHETAYGERQYGVKDEEGHHWLFSRHARNVNPEDWGATVSKPKG